MQNSNQIVNLSKVTEKIFSDMFEFDREYYLHNLVKAMSHLKIRDIGGDIQDFSGMRGKIINLIEEIEKTHFNLKEAWELCRSASELVLDVRRNILLSNQVINLNDLILKLNQMAEFSDNFRIKEKRVGELLGELLNILGSLPKKEESLLRMEYGESVGDEDFGAELSTDWIGIYVEKLNKKIAEFSKDSDHARTCGNLITMIRANCTNTIQRLVQLEGFGEDDGDEEDNEDDEGEENYGRGNRLLVKTQLYILLNDLNLSKEYIVGFDKYLMDHNKYPGYHSSGKLEGWEPELLKLVNKKYKLDNFSFDELLKVATGDIVFLEARFKEDADVMKYLRDKILNNFQGSSGIEVDKEDALYSLKEHSRYLDDDLKKLLYRYVMNNFETNNCLKLLKMFDRYSFIKFLNFYHHYVKKIDLSMLMIGKLYKFYDILKVADERTSEFNSILAGIKALGTKDDDKILGMINRGFMILRILHNNDYGKPDANPNTYDFKFDDFLKDLFLSMLMSKWDLKQDVTDKFINIGLNSKIDDVMNRNDGKINMIAEKMEINLDSFRNNLMEIRGIISDGAEIPFSWREKIYKVDNDLNTLLSGEILLKYTAEVKPKDVRLFNLNYEMGDGMRFEVLPDMSLEYFKVGAATQCCQRPGGAAETSMIDSFVNGLAGVLALKKNNEIISQSYFHYVPKDNGYILDNVEANVRLVKKYGISLDNLYANLANKIRKDWNVNYVKCGKDYNKLNNNLFKNTEMDSDPRYFELGEVYSDFDEKDHIDLMNVKFPLISVDMKKKEAGRFDNLLKLANKFGMIVRFAINLA